MRARARKSKRIRESAGPTRRIAAWIVVALLLGWPPGCGPSASRPVSRLPLPGTVAFVEQAGAARPVRYPQNGIVHRVVGRTTARRLRAGRRRQDPVAYLVAHIPGSLSLPPDSIGSPAGAGRVLAARGLVPGKRILCCAESSCSPNGARLALASGERRGFPGRSAPGWNSGVDPVRPSGRSGRLLTRREAGTSSDTSRMAGRRMWRSASVNPESKSSMCAGSGVESSRFANRRHTERTGAARGSHPHSFPRFEFLCPKEDSLLTPPEVRAILAKIGPRPANPIDLDSEIILYGSGSGERRLSDTTTFVAPACRACAVRRRLVGLVE